MASQHRAVIIGCGGYARVHAQGYKRIPGCELVAGADVAPEKAQAFAAELGTRWYTDWPEMLAKEKPALVSVTTTHCAHAPVTIGVAGAGMGVQGICVEKPIGMDLGEADEMIAACEAHGITLAVGHQRRFNLEWLAGQEIIESGNIGQPQLIVGRWPCQQTAMFTYDLFGGGALPWLGSHTLDLMRMFCGDAKWVLAQVDLADPPADVEKRAYAHMEFEQGVHGVLETGEGMNPDYYRGQTITVYGTEGTVEMVDAVGTRWRSKAHPQWQPVELDMEKVEGSKSNFWATYKLLDDMVQAIAQGREPVCSAANGRAALELCLAIYQSDRLGCRIDLPLREKQSPLKLMVQQRP